MKFMLKNSCFIVLLSYFFIKCTSVGQSFGSAWPNPRLAIIQASNMPDTESANLMSTYQSEILDFFETMKQKSLDESNENKAFVLEENELKKDGTTFRKFQDKFYLQISIEKVTVYNSRSTKGLVGTPWRRAESDFQEGLQEILKSYPANFLKSEFEGLILISTHWYRDFRSIFALNTEENVQFVISHDLKNDFQNFNLTSSELLQNIIIIVNDVRIY